MGKSCVGLSPIIAQPSPSRPPEGVGTRTRSSTLSVSELSDWWLYAELVILDRGPLGSYCWLLTTSAVPHLRVWGSPVLSVAWPWHWCTLDGSIKKNGSHREGLAHHHFPSPFVFALSMLDCIVKVYNVRYTGYTPFEVPKVIVRQYAFHFINKLGLLS